MPRAPYCVPEKFCKQCGKKLERKRYGSRLESLGVFNLRKYCDLTCMGNDQEGKIKVSNDKNSRRQSAKEVKSACESCGRRDTRLHVHHVDCDPLNNAAENLKTLCASCHRNAHIAMREDTETP